MKRSGFTTMELVVVIIMIGAIAAIGLPKMRTVLDKTNVRSARQAVVTYTAMARAVAAERSCPSAVHFAYSTTSRVWVTACRIRPVTGLDTIGPVAKLYDSYKVTITSTTDSVGFDPRGLRLNTSNTTTVRFLGNVAGNSDSIVINQLGKVVR